LLVNFISAAEKKVLRFSKAHFGLNNAAGWTDWPNFCLLGDYLLWAVFSIYVQKKPKCLVCLFPRDKLCINFVIRIVGLSTIFFVTDVMIFFLNRRKIFRRKFTKIAENCDHNIDPWSPWLAATKMFPEKCHFFVLHMHTHETNRFQFRKQARQEKKVGHKISDARNFSANRKAR
jgi:hypothetical protein